MPSNPGTYTGSYASLVNTSIISFTITKAGSVSGPNSPSSIYDTTPHTLTNFGKVTGLATAGVDFSRGGVVINGSPSDSSAYIKGYSTGVSLLGTTPGTVTNYGLIESTYRGNGPFGYTNADFYHTGRIGFDGIYLHVGGKITNSGASANIYGYDGVQIAGGTLSVTNSGTIAGYSEGISMLRGSTGLSLSNSGLIHSRVNEAILAYSGRVSIVNTGTILATGTVSEYISFGSASNRYSGGIYVGSAVSAGATITNGSATNSTALIEGFAYGINVYETNGATITNWGKIEGTGTQYIGSGGSVNSPQVAVSFNYTASAADRLVDEPGSTFVGLAEGGGTDSVLELATASGTGTIGGIGTQFVGFGTIAVDAGATWNMTGADTIAATTVGTNPTNMTLSNAGTIDVTGTLTLGSGGALTSSGRIDVLGGEFVANLGVGAAGSFNIGSSGRIDFTSAVSSGTINFLDATGKLILADPAGATLTLGGFVEGDQIDLPSVTYDTGHMTATYSGGHMTVFDNGVEKADIQVTGLIGNTFIPSNDGTGHTEITPLCYCRGTGIATPLGDMAVEDLCVGDMVLTVRGNARPIVWIGAGRVLATRGRRNAATPVIVRRGALADNVPHRDLHVTKAHSLYLDGVLIPVEFLVNHRSILWDDQAQEVTIYHIELETHDVLLANGAPAESYRDDGNRWLFQNGNTEWDQPPKPPYAPVLTGGPVVDAAWRRLLDRAGPRPGLPLTDDPDLHLLIDGKRVDAASQTGNVYVFNVRRAPDEMRLISCAAVPQELGLVRDPRCLGIAVRRFVVRQGTRFRTFRADDALLAVGFHAFEADKGLRWTDGNAFLPPEMLAGFAGPIELVVHLGGSTQYIGGLAATRAA